MPNKIETERCNLTLNSSLENKLKIPGVRDLEDEVDRKRERRMNLNFL